MNTFMKTSMLTASLFAIASSAQAVTVFTDNFDNDTGGDGDGVGAFAMSWVEESVGTQVVGANAGVENGYSTSGDQSVFFNTGDGGDGSGGQSRQAAIHIDTGYANANGTIYTLDYDLIYRSWTGPFAAELYVGDPTGGGTLLNSFIATNPPTIDNSSQANQHVYVGDGTVGNIFIRFHAQEPSAGFQQARLDTVSLDAVIPEPGSLALLGLGGLVMLRRRRSV